MSNLSGVVREGWLKRVKVNVQYICYDMFLFYICVCIYLALFVKHSQKYGESFLCYSKTNLLCTYFYTFESSSIAQCLPKLEFLGCKMEFTVAFSNSMAMRFDISIISAKLARSSDQVVNKSLPRKHKR